MKKSSLQLRRPMRVVRNVASTLSTRPTAVTQFGSRHHLSFVQQAVPISDSTTCGRLVVIARFASLLFSVYASERTSRSLQSQNVVKCSSGNHNGKCCFRIWCLRFHIYCFIMCVYLRNIYFHGGQMVKVRYHESELEIGSKLAKLVSNSLRSTLCQPIEYNWIRKKPRLRLKWVVRWLKPVNYLPSIARPAVPLSNLDTSAKLC